MSGYAATLNNFAFTGSTSNFVGGQFGGSLALDGSNDYIDLGNPTALNVAAVSVVMWVKTLSLSQALQFLFNKELSNAYCQIYLNSTGKLSMYIGYTSSNTNYDGTGNFTLGINKWYQIALTYSSEKGLIGYVNGSVDKAVTPVNQNMVTINSSAEIGRQSGQSRNWTGNMAEIRIYNRALPANEVAELYSNPHVDLLNNKTHLYAIAAANTFKPVDPMGMNGIFGI